MTTRQPAETCGYQVSLHHTHLSHILRPILSYIIPKRGVPRQGEQSLVVIISYGLLPTYVLMQWKIQTFKSNGKQTHSSEFMIPTRISTCPISCLESSPTLSHMLVPYMKIVSKQKYLFYLWATLRYKYVGQSSKVNLLDNSPKTNHGPLRHKLLDDFPKQLFGQFFDKIFF